ncbi:MAG: ATP-binding protein [Hyphomonadaceae bacterium]|nr:ATP-binding protein [Hyphomonadaceae bacterium]
MGSETSGPPTKSHTPFQTFLAGMHVPPLAGLMYHGLTALIFAALGHWQTGAVLLVAVLSLENALNFLFRSLFHQESSREAFAVRLVALAVFVRSLLCSGVVYAIGKTGEPGSASLGLGLLILNAMVLTVQLATRPWLLVLSLAPLAGMYLAVTFNFNVRAPQSTLILLAIAVVLTVATVAWTLARWMRRSMKTEEALLQKTQALEAELALRDAEKAFRTQLETEAGLGFFEADQSGPLVWSPGMYRIFGHDPDLPPLGLEDIEAQVSDGSGAARRAELLAAVARGEPLTHDYAIRCGDGNERHVRAIIMPTTDREGAVWRIHGAVIDETALRANHRKMEALERRLEVALSAGGTALWEHDFQTGRSFAIGAMREFLGREPDFGTDLMAAVMERVHPDDRAMVAALGPQVMASGKPVEIEHRIEIEGREQGWVRTRLLVTPGNGDRGMGVITALSTDITDEVARREALAGALNAAEAASRAKSSFLANMSHEIRTPLHGILAVADLLAQSDLDPRQREMTGLIQASGTALSAVVNDVLDLARVESGRLEINCQPVNLPSLVRSSVDLFQLKAAEKGIALCVDFSIDPDLVVSADPVRLSQVVTNLVSNAVKFTHVGGVTVTLDARPASDSHDGRLAVQIDVADTGTGIPEDQVASLFNRFEQLDGSITRLHGGSGLGLAIAQSLAGLMGGKITLTSRVGQGTTFTMVLELDCAALETPAPVQGETSSSPAEDKALLRVLAADDHPTNREVLRLVLAPLGVDLTLCENGQEAVDAFKSASYDVVLMDLQMPVMDGLTAMRLIRAHEQETGQARTPMAAVTANAMEQHRIEALAAGADAHIAKPYTPDRLVGAVSELLDQAAADSQPGQPEGLSQTAA